MKHNKSKSWLLHRHVSTQWLLRGHVRSVCTVWSYVCLVCTEQTVLLVRLVLLVIVNALVDTSAQIKVTKGLERGQIELNKLLSQHVCCSNNCMSMDGQDVTMGRQYGGRFKDSLLWFWAILQYSH